MVCEEMQGKGNCSGPTLSLPTGLALVSCFISRNAYQRQLTTSPSIPKEIARKESDGGLGYGIGNGKEYAKRVKRFLPDKSSIISCDRMLVQRK